MKVQGVAPPARGFSLIEILIVVGIIGMIVGIGMSNILRARSRAQQQACMGNLYQLHSALQQWAWQNNKGSSDTVAMSDLTPYLRKQSTPVCPGGGSYSVTAVGTEPECSLKASGHTL